MSRSAEKNLRDLVESSTVFQEGFTGMVLMDPETSEVLYSYRDSKYFTPASNIKILTLYSALEILGDSIPIFHYSYRGDSIIILGAGGPGLWHPELERNLAADYFFKKLSPGEKLYFSYQNFPDKRFGSGWAWDDFPYYFQSEKSPLPLFGNVVKFTFLPGEIIPNIEPDYFKSWTQFRALNEVDSGRVVVGREENSNEFFYHADGLNGDTLVRYVPFLIDSVTLSALFREVIDVKLECTKYLPKAENRVAIYAAKPDSVYRRMMYVSDNFIAEQLLLACSGVLFDTLSTQKAIQYVSDSLLADLPDPLNWVDGSGLSRYNLLTPRSMAHLLTKMYHQHGPKVMLEYFPAGGQHGNLKNWYRNEDKPYLYAKTGTLRNNHSLSGYLVGRSGRIFVFSFMHSNFPGSSIPHRREMEQILHFLSEEL